MCKSSLLTLCSVVNPNTDQVYLQQAVDALKLTRLTVGHDTLPFITRLLNKDLYLQVAYERYINFGVVTDFDLAYIVRKLKLNKQLYFQGQLHNHDKLFNQLLSN